MDRHQNRISFMTDELCTILQKEAAVGSLVELAGLGMLAAPHIVTKGRLGGYLASAKGERVIELAGLGALALPSMADVVKPLFPRRLQKKFPVQKAPHKF